MAGTTTARTHPLDLDALAHAIADEGVERHRAEVAGLAAAAVDAGAPASLIGALTDPATSEVARQRAFGRIAAALAEQLPRPAGPGPVTGLREDDPHPALV